MVVTGFFAQCKTPVNEAMPVINNILVINNTVAVLLTSSNALSGLVCTNLHENGINMVQICLTA